ncbi:MAG: hypothetical protein O3A46_12400 [Candidatus Poribacteria bacterium]|nr:hypothetical protein [Candidatus Poribacteria bacterium]
MKRWCEPSAYPVAPLWALIAIVALAVGCTSAAPTAAQPQMSPKPAMETANARVKPLPLTSSPSIVVPDRGAKPSVLPETRVETTTPAAKPVASKTEADFNQVFDITAINVDGDWPATDVRFIMEDISFDHELTIVVADRVTGTLSLSNVKGMPFEELLDLVTSQVGASWKRVAPTTFVIASNSARNPSFAEIAQTRVIDLNYISTAQLRDMMPDYAVEYVRTDSTHPTVVVTAPLAYLERITTFIQKIDRPQIQVVLHTVVAELREGSSQLLSLNGSTGYTRRASTVSVDGSPTTPNGLSSLSGGRTEDGDTFVHDFAITTIGNFSNSVLLQLRALKQSGQAKISVDTGVLAQNGKEAQINFTTEEFVKIQTGTVAFPRTDLERITAGVTVRVTPQVAENGDITMILQPEVNDVIGIGADNLPLIQRRSVNSTVRVKDGETIVIGGMIEEREEKQERKVPLPGSIPLLGALFRTTDSSKTRREVMIFITPRITNGSDDWDAPLRQVGHINTTP